MDRFLNSGYGQSSVAIGGIEEPKTNRTVGSLQPRTGLGGGGGGSNLVSYISGTHANTIRPSVSFVSMNRGDYRQNHYTDEMDGPSPM